MFRPVIIQIKRNTTVGYFWKEFSYTEMYAPEFLVNKLAGLFFTLISYGST